MLSLGPGRPGHLSSTRSCVRLLLVWFGLVWTRLTDADEFRTPLQEVLANDFFLVALQDEFRENARLFIFETYCRIHERIDMRGLAERLNMSFDHAERWIVDLIRNAR